jgi:sarcosine oxidase
MNVGIVGCGILGLATALELRARGHAVTIFEQGQVPNERASSTDTSKTIRRLYGNNATYVELVERAAPKWRQWHERLGRDFYFPIGQIQIEEHFAPGNRIHDSFHFFARRAGEVRLLSVSEARERYPQFSYRDSDTIVYDPWAGYLASGQAVAKLAQLARAEGISLHAETPVREIQEGALGVELVTAGGAASFDRVVVAAGVWLTRLIPSIGRHLRPTFQQMAFFEPPDPTRFAPGPMPVWAVNVEDEGWYGHPLRREGWVKVANDLLGEVVDPDVERKATSAFLESAREFVARRIPGLAKGRLVGSRACLYENTPDRDFVIDRAPGSQRIVVAGGGSGHGFKFGGSIGEVIADAVEDKHNPLGDAFRIGQRFGK